MKNLLITFSFLFFAIGLIAQTTFPTQGISDYRTGTYAFTNVDIFVQYNQKIENATMVIEQGKVKAIGTGVAVPSDAIILDMQGKTIYPGFIDLYTNYGMPKPEAEGKRPKKQPQALSNKKGAYSWNEALKPEFNATAAFANNPKEAATYRQIGFTALLSHRMDGISRGTSTLVALNENKEHQTILKTNAAHHLSFKKGTSTQNYPSSLMGCIALLRQTYIDGKWHTDHGGTTNLSLDAWNASQGLPQIFDARNRLEVLRAQKVAQEFGKQYIYKGTGDEYMRLDALKNTNAAFIIPVNFPLPYDVEDPFDAEMVATEDLKHWELAPSNPARLAKAGVHFAFTSYGLKNKTDFLKNIRKAIAYGLSEADALKALTHNPALIIGASNQIGNLQTGRQANFIITDGNIFNKKTKILQNWSNGEAYVIHNESEGLKDGIYHLTVGGENYKLSVDNKSYQIKSESDTNKLTTKKTIEGDLLSIYFNNEKEETIRLNGTIDKTHFNASGKGKLANGEWVDWSATITREPLKKKVVKATEVSKIKELSIVTYPFRSYGWTEQPKAEKVLFKNATVWTNEADGILENTDVLIENGKISKVGKDLSSNGAKVVEAQGKHLTAGIIDEHSHVGISLGVNEGTQYSSAEVSIGDVVNSEEVNIYRQLAGGVTAAQLLHGSANPIGGQSALIKMRWGSLPEEMKIKDADGFIKFALGENVKQSNWGDHYDVRFPQSRMGVEQVFDDHFTRAKEYEQLKNSGQPYRKDLEMEALLEIINSQRFISCHSYQQGEVNMLMKVAEKHGFAINTFTHILEGYKVADKMKQHGVGGSTFSDWWAYKYEVIDAIPHNAAIMQEEGVVTAINSDDAEIARRLNQETAKSILYTPGFSEEEAWKMVTLNPAKLLHLDKQTGSIKVGKDADVVLWSANPLSVYTRAEQTYVDGVLLFDLEMDKQLRQSLREERARIIQKMIAEKAGGGETQKAHFKHHHHYHCDHIHDEVKE